MHAISISEEERTMASWDVFRELDSLRREMDEALRGAGTARVMVPAFLSGTRRFPLVNLGEDDQSIRVEALVPGIDPKTLEMSVVHNTLTLAGERKPVEVGDRPHAWHRNERGFGKFSRTLELPAQVDVDKVSASCENGLLTITLPKAEAAKPRKIAVKAA
jgi:HSP20 family protein